MHDPEEVIRFLGDRRSYPHPTDPFEVHETHISRVFVAGPHAYKLKKPVSLGFVDYSTLERRRWFCEEEVRLNRRLARDVYLGVASVRRKDGRLILALEGEKDGTEVESLVLMRRVPREATLQSLLERGLATRSHIDQLVERLVPFYRQAPRTPDPGPGGATAPLRKTLLENFEITRAHAGDLLPLGHYHASRSRQLTFLALRRRLFEERARAGWVRDGHGDLRAEHIAYLPGCVVLDCVEFNERLRVIDIASDLAFLVMDLEFLGAPELGRHLVEAYVRASGDAGMRQVLEFYVGYRAYVRGKVDGIKLHQPEVVPTERERLRKRAARFFELAHYHAIALDRPGLVLVGGLSGTGKSTLGRELAAELGAPLFRSDEVRREVAGAASPSPAKRGFNEGIYAEEITRRTYETLIGRGRDSLLAGATVILDATFSKREWRTLAREAARDAGARAVHLECRVSKEAAAERMRARAEAGSDPSAATPEMQQAQAAAYEPCAPGEAVVIDTSGPSGAAIEAALEALRTTLAPGGDAGAPGA